MCTICSCLPKRMLPRTPWCSQALIPEWVNRQCHREGLCNRARVEAASKWVWGFRMLSWCCWTVQRFLWREALHYLLEDHRFTQKRWFAGMNSNRRGVFKMVSSGLCSILPPDWSRRKWSAVRDGAQMTSCHHHRMGTEVPQCRTMEKETWPVGCGQSVSW